MTNEMHGQRPDFDVYKVVKSSFFNQWQKMIINKKSIFIQQKRFIENLDEFFNMIDLDDVYKLLNEQISAESSKEKKRYIKIVNKRRLEILSFKFARYLYEISNHGRIINENIIELAFKKLKEEKLCSIFPCKMRIK